MKTKFTNKEVPHIWAQQNQQEGYGHNVFFKGPVIYSYGHHFPMARFIDGNTVLFTTRTYSVSTAKHLRATRDSIPAGVKIFNVHNVGDYAPPDHSQNVATMLHEIEDAVPELAKSKSRRAALMVQMDSNIKEMQAYKEYFKVKIAKADKARFKKIISGKFISLDELSKALEKVKRQNAERKRLNTARAAQEAKEVAERTEKWLAGTLHGTLGYLDKIMLRVNGDEVETSRGAKIPLAVAHKLWNRIKDGSPVEGMNLGHYTVNQYVNEVLVAGCHRIPLAEMQRLANTLGW